ncbi:MAG TPA: carbon-nitrogen hydrolase family protein [Thermoleophilia bacterium]
MDSLLRSPRPALLAAGIQLAAIPGDTDENLAKIERLGRSVARDHAGLDLLVLPELGVTGYSAGERFFDLAEPWPEGGVLRRLSGLAAELDVVLVAGYAEAGETPDVIYDSAAVFDRDGRPVTSYRKTHCLDTERRFFANGDELPLVTTSAGRLGVMICWDGAFPEVARTYALAGADLLVMIGAWEDPHVRDWDLVVSARAYDNVVPVVAVNRTGADGDGHFSGHSRIVDCLGVTVAELGAEEDGLVVGSVDLERTRELRAGYGSQLRDRRPELYGAVGAPVTVSGRHPSSTERK